jgi:hypothetical protein
VIVDARAIRVQEIMTEGRGHKLRAALFITALCELADDVRTELGAAAGVLRVAPGASSWTLFARIWARP